MAGEKIKPVASDGQDEAQSGGKKLPTYIYIAFGIAGLVVVGLLAGIIVLATSGSASVSLLDDAISSMDKVNSTDVMELMEHVHFASTKPPAQTNLCDGTKPTSGFDNKDCFVGETINALEQAGGNITKGYVGELTTSAVPILTQYYEAGLCPVNVHWHLGTEHLSVGEFDEDGSGPSEIHDRRRAAGKVRKGYQCNHFDANEPTHTKAYDWKHCMTMEVGQTYEVHWPHSKGGMCGTVHQYQTPFYDGVFCVGSRLVPTTQEAIGVQGQIFMIVNDEQYYYPDLIRGMIMDATHGNDVAAYTGSTTGTSRDNTICSSYTPITWQVDRVCHPISASSFDKMCADMKAQNDDMTDDLHPHGARELVISALVADNHVTLGDQFP